MRAEFDCAPEQDVFTQGAQGGDSEVGRGSLAGLLALQADKVRRGPREAVAQQGHKAVQLLSVVQPILHAQL